MCASIAAARIGSPRFESDGSTTLEFKFDANDPVFAGHFIGRPGKCPANTGSFASNLNSSVVEPSDSNRGLPIRAAAMDAHIVTVCLPAFHRTFAPVERRVSHPPFLNPIYT